ncbi:hypothetical protein [Streptomyces chilikensis]|uniref:Uncharacterized protein n=1 Tax=Streptomyces chilikensis TaxID=1194079 RepID=A0ABV3EJD3_9ACTN
MLLTTVEETARLFFEAPKGTRIERDQAWVMASERTLRAVFEAGWRPAPGDERGTPRAVTELRIALHSVERVAGLLGELLPERAVAQQFAAWAVGQGWRPVDGECVTCPDTPAALE